MFYWALALAVAIGGATPSRDFMLPESRAPHETSVAISIFERYRTTHDGVIRVAVYRD